MYTKILLLYQLSAMVSLSPFCEGQMDHVAALGNKMD